MDYGSIDPCFGPTTFMDQVHGPPVMVQVHGHFSIMIERFSTKSMDALLKNEK